MLRLAAVVAERHQSVPHVGHDLTVRAVSLHLLHVLQDHVDHGPESRVVVYSVLQGLLELRILGVAGQKHVQFAQILSLQHVVQLLGYSVGDPFDIASHLSHSFRRGSGIITNTF